jgi:hypothetical protein
MSNPYFTHPIQVHFTEKATEAERQRCVSVLETKAALVLLSGSPTAYGIAAIYKEAALAILNTKYPVKYDSVFEEWRNDNDPMWGEKATEGMRTDYLFISKEEFYKWHNHGK